MSLEKHHKWVAAFAPLLGFDEAKEPGGRPRPKLTTEFIKSALSFRLNKKFTGALIRRWRTRENPLSPSSPEIAEALLNLLRESGVIVGYDELKARRAELLASLGWDKEPESFEWLLHLAFAAAVKDIDAARIFPGDNEPTGRMEFKTVSTLASCAISQATFKEDLSHLRDNDSLFIGLDWPVSARHSDSVTRQLIGHIFEADSFHRFLSETLEREGSKLNVWICLYTEANDRGELPAGAFGRLEELSKGIQNVVTVPTNRNRLKIRHQTLNDPDWRLPRKMWALLSNHKSSGVKIISAWDLVRHPRLIETFNNESLGTFCSPLEHAVASAALETFGVVKSKDGWAFNDGRDLLGQTTVSR